MYMCSKNGEIVSSQNYKKVVGKLYTNKEREIKDDFLVTDLY